MYVCMCENGKQTLLSFTHTHMHMCMFSVNIITSQVTGTHDKSDTILHMVSLPYSVYPVANVRG